MRTLDEALLQFAYHPATPEVAKTYATLRAGVMTLVKNTWDLIPNGPEKTIALRGMQQFLMHANLAVALTTEADLTTPDVARVLPDQDEVPRVYAVHTEEGTFTLTEMVAAFKSEHPELEFYRERTTVENVGGVIRWEWEGFVRG